MNMILRDFSYPSPKSERIPTVAREDRVFQALRTWWRGWEVKSGALLRYLQARLDRLQEI